jgi:hypothetical protein
MVEATIGIQAPPPRSHNRAASQRNPRGTRPSPSSESSVRSNGSRRDIGNTAWPGSSSRRKVSGGWRAPPWFPRTHLSDHSSRSNPLVRSKCRSRSRAQSTEAGMRLTASGQRFVAIADEVPSGRYSKYHSGSCWDVWSCAPAVAASTTRPGFSRSRAQRSGLFRMYSRIWFSSSSFRTTCS